MEKNKKSKRRINYLLNRFAENIDPLTTNTEQLIAKDILIQIADQHLNTLNSKTPKINGWFNTKNNENIVLEHDAERALKYFRRTVHIKPFTENKSHNQSYNQIQKQNQSVIPLLKSQLQKLESPQKLKETQEKKKKLQYLQSKIKRKNEPILVEQLLQTKRNSVRIKHFSSDKKTNKTNTIHNFIETRTRKMIQRQNNLVDCKSSTQKIELIKEARKNRTLRNILF